MSNNSGTLVIAPIRPQSDQDTFPSAYANELLGGYYQVGSASARDAIPASRRQEGMTCYLQDTQATYKLVGGIDNANWVLATSGGGHIIQSGTSSLPQEPALQFLGNVTVTDNPGSASVVTILGGGSGTVTDVTGVAPILSTGGNTPAISLGTSSVSPGSYTNLNATIDSYGRVLSASNGSSGGHVIQYGSMSVPQEPNLSFVGNVNITDNALGSASVVTILGSATSTLYYFQDGSSSITGYKKMIVTPYNPFTTFSTGSVVTNAVLLNFATIQNVPNVSFIPAGQYEFHIHASKASGTVHVFAEFWECDTNGVDIALIGTSETSPALTSSEVEYRLFFTNSDVYTMASKSSRIVARIKSGTASSLPTVNLYYGGEADSHIALPSPSLDAGNFIPYTGATADVNLGAHNLITAGSASVNNIQITTGAALGKVWTAIDALGNAVWSTPTSGTGSSTYGSDWKNVKLDYGAVGDGTVDDTTALNNAFNSGYNIYLPAGSYAISSSITVSNALTIQGAGKFKTDIKIITNNANGLLLEHDFIILKDFQITESVTAISGNGIIIGYSGTVRNWIEFHNVDIAFTYYGMTLKNANDCTFDNVSFTSIIRCALYVNNTNPNGDNVFNNTLMTNTTSNTAYGLLIDQADVTHYIGMKILNYQMPVVIQGITGNVTKQYFTSLSIEGNTASGHLFDVIKGGAYAISNIEIQGGNVGASVTNDNLIGISLGNGTTNHIISNVIVSNLGSASGSIGVYLAGQYSQLSNMNIGSIKGSGLLIAATAAYDNVVNSNINNNGTYGLTITAGATYLGVYNNVIVGNTTANYNIATTLLAAAANNNFMGNPGLANVTQDNLAIGISSPMSPIVGSKYLTIKALSERAIMELAGSKADADGAVLGEVIFYDVNSNVAAYIVSASQGSTVNSRGANISIYTKKDNGVPTQAIVIDNTQTVIMNNPPKFAGTNATGSGTALFSTNCPAVTPTAPYKWIQIVTADGSTAYIPCWK